MSKTNFVTPKDIRDHIQRVLEGLNAAQQKYLAENYTNLAGRPGYEWHAKERSKFVALDVGSSGAFLVEKDTGELFNIKAYGVPDRNKKIKADIGNVRTVDPGWLFSKRWNYLR